MYLIYNLLLFVFVVLYSPVICYKLFKGEYRKNIKQRLGFLGPEVTEDLSDKDIIWVHAVSVGETVAAEPVVGELKERFDCQIVFSTVTETGQKMARKIIPADKIIYFPLDFSFAVKKALQAINPRAVVIMETELWPNFIKTAARQGRKIMLANGRISDKSFQRYHYLGSLLKDMLANIDVLSMQSERDKTHIIELGADENKVYNNGNTKFDREIKPQEEWSKDEIYKEFKLSLQQPVLIAGSTHPNEEEQLIPVFQELKSKFGELVMIIAPRHINRIEEIEKLYHNEGIRTVKRTALQSRTDQPVILLDTIGELSSLYVAADLVFVGGSLIEKGGHNVLEPAVWGKPVFFGPHMFNFRDNVRLIKEYEAGIQVENAAELTEKLLHYLQNPQQREEKSQNALKMISENKGAAAQNVKQLEVLLE
ncbi:MAG: 3-deoxy-D-manno-octulosonic acid transferase [Bacillota bacterium]